MLLAREKKLHSCKGISGWLSPKGEFIPADYGEHAKVALDLEINGRVKPIIDMVSGKQAHGERLLELQGYIKFVCRFVYGKIIESYIFFPQQFGCTQDVTDSQIEWLTENYEKMSCRQKVCARQYFSQDC